MKWTDLITPVIIIAFIVYASIMLWLINSKEVTVKEPVTKVIDKPYRLPGQINTIRDTLIKSIKYYEQYEEDSIVPFLGNDTIWSSERQRAYWTRVIQDR